MVIDAASAEVDEDRFWWRGWHFAVIHSIKFSIFNFNIPPMSSHVHVPCHPPLSSPIPSSLPNPKSPPLPSSRNRHVLVLHDCVSPSHPLLPPLSLSLILSIFNFLNSILSTTPFLFSNSSSYYSVDYHIFSCFSRSLDISDVFYKYMYMYKEILLTYNSSLSGAYWKYLGLLPCSPLKCSPRLIRWQNSVWGYLNHALLIFPRKLSVVGLYTNPDWWLMS